MRKYSTCLFLTSSLALLSALVLPATPLFASDAAQGKETFGKMCASCHGPEGAGDGPAAAALPPAMKPRDLQLGGFKYASDDTKMKELISKGGTAVGLSPLMAPQPSLTESDLDNLVAFIASLKK